MLHPRFQLLAREIGRLPELASASEAEVRGVLDRAAAHFLTGKGSRVAAARSTLTGRRTIAPRMPAGGIATAVKELGPEDRAA